MAVCWSIWDIWVNTLDIAPLILHCPPLFSYCLQNWLAGLKLECVPLRYWYQKTPEIFNSHEFLLIWYYCIINMSGWCWKDIDLSLSWHELSQSWGWHLEMDWSLFLRDQRPMTTSLNYLVSSLSPAPSPAHSNIGGAWDEPELLPIRVFGSLQLANQKLELCLVFHPGIDIMICPPSTGTLFYPWHKCTWIQKV